jgi:hypothetical protein
VAVEALRAAGHVVAEPSPHGSGAVPDDGAAP